MPKDGTVKRVPRTVCETHDSSHYHNHIYGVLNRKFIAQLTLRNPCETQGNNSLLLVTILLPTRESSLSFFLFFSFFFPPFSFPFPFFLSFFSRPIPRIIIIIIITSRRTRRKRREIRKFHGFQRHAWNRWSIWYLTNIRISKHHHCYLSIPPLLHFQERIIKRLESVDDISFRLIGAFRSKAGQVISLIVPRSRNGPRSHWLNGISSD